MRSVKASLRRGNFPNERNLVASPVRKAKREPTKHMKAASKIAAHFRREIVFGNLNPGDKLPSERELGEKFKVSRPTLREAMLLLESESLIKISRGQYGGATVKSLDVSVAARQVGMFLQMDGTTLADVYEARTFLEPPAARLLARQRPLHVIEALRENIVQSNEALERGDAISLANGVTAFSEILTREMGNKTMGLLCMLLKDLVRRQMQDVALRTYSREIATKMHRLNIRGREKVTELIEAGQEEEAEKYWRLQLVEGGKVTLSAYRANMPINVLDEIDES